MAWIKRREAELSEPGALDAGAGATLSDAIGKYTDTSRREIGRTKAQCLDLIRRHPIAEMRCAAIKSSDVSSFAEDMLNGWTPEGETRKRTPQTVGNYMSHLGAVFAAARPMWGYPLDHQAFRDSATVTKRLGLTSKSQSRNRRPTLNELDTLLTFFDERAKKARQSMPMHKVILFALFSARRQEEIIRLRWDDYDRENKRTLVRDMKHPGEKIGNDVWCDLPPEAMAVIDSMPKGGDLIFPYSTDAVSANFTRACKVLGIDDLHFHDLRHEATSRLFELGNDIPHVAIVTGHRSWTSLKRYAHIRQRGDKYAGWKWNPIGEGK